MPNRPNLAPVPLRDILAVAREIAGPTVPTCVYCREPLFSDHKPDECYALHLAILKGETR